MALNRSDKSRILRRYSPGMTRNSEMSTEPRVGSSIINSTVRNETVKVGSQLYESVVEIGQGVIT